MGERGDRPQKLQEHPPTPAIEKWDCDIEEEEPKAAAAATDQEEKEEENWDTASDELFWENLVTPPTDYSGIPTPEEEEEGLASAEVSLPTKEDEDGIWFRCPSPCWRVREEWKQATYAQRGDMEKYYLVHGPDLDLTLKDTERETTLI